MEESESEAESSFDRGGFGFAPSRVSLTPFTPIPPPSSRRLSSSFYEPSRPLSSARKLAYVSLQGRLVNAEEATSARTIGGGLSRDQAVAWEMFTPIQRVILVAVIGVAVSESKKNRIISNLQKSVELRDQVLLSMQQKLDSLCEQVNNNNAKDQQGSGKIFSDAQDSGFPLDASFKSNGMDFVDCGCWLCDQHHKRLHGLVSHSLTKASSGDVTSFFDEAEPEERRMSDLSDWASSVTSSAEIQMVNGLALEQDITNLKKECEEKDATIRELSSFLQTSDSANSKRISELEDIIRRKNMIITKLKKDLVVLEQKVVQLTRLQRASSSSSSIDADTRQLPVMAENLLYDMDSTTSPSSSDSDRSPMSRQMATIIKIQETPKEKNDDALCKEMSTMSNQESLKDKNDNTLRRDRFSSTKKGSKIRHTDKHSQSRYDSPLKEISMNQKSSRISYVSQRQRLLSGGDSNRKKRHTHSGSKGLTPMKRWS